MIKSIEYKCIEGGDNKYCSIACFNIGEVARDEYIENLCEKIKLNEYYEINKNKGYGTKNLSGIANYGISCWHRKSFGICNHLLKITNSMWNNSNYFYRSWFY